MSRKPFIAGNWKMYKTTAEGLSFSNEFRKLVSDVRTGISSFARPSLCSSLLHRPLREAIYKLGAQNMYSKKEGAFTGEISPLQLLDAGAALHLSSGIRNAAISSVKKTA